MNHLAHCLTHVFQKKERRLEEINDHGFCCSVVSFTVLCYIFCFQYKNKLGKEACTNNDKIRRRESFGEKASFYNCQGLVFVGVVVTRKDDSSAQLFTSQSTIDVNLVVCGTAFFLAFFFPSVLTTRCGNTENDGETSRKTGSASGT